MNPYAQKLGQRTPKSGKNRRARVEIIPLIDVMFLLVAFFMVISIAMVRQKGIRVDLSPAITADSAMEEADTVVVSVANNGTLYLNKKEILSRDLALELKRIAKKDSDTSVVINADKEARHESVIKALDVIRQSGLHTVIFSVEPEE